LKKKQSPWKQLANSSKLDMSTRLWTCLTGLCLTPLAPLHVARLPRGSRRDGAHRSEWNKPVPPSSLSPVHSAPSTRFFLHPSWTRAALPPALRRSGRRPARPGHQELAPPPSSSLHDSLQLLNYEFNQTVFRSSSATPVRFSPPLSSFGSFSIRLQCWCMSSCACRFFCLKLNLHHLKKL
jgi:hypothetical protein